MSENSLPEKRLKLSLEGRRNASKQNTSITNVIDKCLDIPVSKSASDFSPGTDVNKDLTRPNVTDDETGPNHNSGINRLAALPNIGNTCFMNSVLHVLRVTPNFVPWLHRTAFKLQASHQNGASELSTVHKIYQSLSEMEKHKSPATDYKMDEELELHLRLLMNLFANQNPGYSPGQQFDAHEFLCWLVEVLRGRSYGGKRPPKNTDDFVPSVLEGKAKNVVHCNECETSTEHEDMFWDIKMPLSCICEAEETDVRANFNSDTVLRGNDKYHCSWCLHLTEARHSLKILTLPSVLILHVPSKWQNGDKSAFKVAEELPCIKNGCVNNCQDPRHLFRLYALLIHIGSTSQFGHYVTLARRPSDSPKDEEMSRKRYRTRSRQMIWENCCEMHHDLISPNSWIVCNDDEIVCVDSLMHYFDSMASLSARPALLWYQRHQ